ncbi:MAG TPA: amino acid adenylation domain-containing protein [Actinophytocola sp.]|nr:amino acid adenylation domain-containing protein [Actinophytocola sp.]
MSLDRSVDLVVALLGVLKSGAGYLPLDPGQPAARRAFIMADAECELVVGRAGADLPGRLVPVEEDGGRPDTDPDAAGDPGHVAYVIYTSGSTGEPKGVPVTHANVLRLMRGCARDFGFGADDVWTLFHSYAFDFSVWELWGALLFGGRLVVVPFGVSREPQDFLALLRAERVTVLNQTPSAFRGLLAAVSTEAATGPDDLALRVVVFGGEALDVTELEPWFDRFGDRKPLLVNMYGITETTVHVTYRPVARGERVRSPIGRPLRDLRVYLLDDAHQPVPEGVPGQVFVSGPGLARGYLGRPALTADRFGPDPHSPVPGARMYRTGDLARWTADGDLEFLGRVDAQLSIRGHRIEPGEVEAAIAAHPDVDRGVVVAHRRPGERDDRLLAYFAAAAGKSVSAADLREHLGGRLPGYMVPVWYVPMASIPMTANGKVDRAALPDPNLARADAGTAHVPPRTPVEQIMAEAWAEVLGTDRVGVHDNFFAAGGDSIRAIQVVGALRARGLPVTVQNLLVHQDIDGLARFVGGTDGTGPSQEDRRVEPFAMIDAADRARLPGDVVDAYPMSLVQAAMVYQMVADADEHPYHNVTRYPMADDAPFDLLALRTAAANAGQRHEILRTSFDLTGYAEPMQLVHRTGAIEVGYEDLRGRSDARERIELFTEEVRRHPLDPATAPLVRFHVQQTADDRWTMSLVECHAVLDGWSHHSLIQELLTDYRALRDGREPEPVPPPGVRFADFIALERQALDAHATREFWRDRVGGFAAAEPPATWAADPAAAERAHHHLVSFQDLEPGLRALAATGGVPLKSVLFAAHLTVLAAIGGTRRFHTGLVCNGRPETAGGTAVRGMHLNTVPFCADLTGAGTWTDLVRDVFAEEVAIWPHRRFPLPRMQRDWGRSRPLVDIAFTYLDFHVLDSSRIESDDVVDVSPNEFGLDVWTFPGVFTISARPDRISRGNGARLAAMYRRVLEAMAADPTGDPRGSLLGPEESARLLAFADGPELPRADKCLHELFEQQVARTPDAVALRHVDGQSVSYAELNGRANRLARHLRSLGVRQESRVGVLLARGPELVTALLAVLKAGAAYLPLDPAHPAARLRGLVAGSGVAVVLTQPELTDLLDGSAARVVTADPIVLSGLSTADLGPTATPASLAYVIHTSGSTGTPKGVLVEHRNVVNYVTWCLGAYQPRGGTGSPLFSAMSFDLPVTSLFPALLTGQPVTITADDGTPGLDGLVDALENGEFGLLKLTPSHLAVLNRVLSPRGVRRATGRIVAGGEELVRDDVSAWAEHAPDTLVVNEYGPTETTVGCSYLEDTAATLPSGVLPIGRPVANTTMRVLDADQRMVPVGVVGELYVGGAQVARGYDGRPDLTAAKFVPDPYSVGPGARLYRTGDLARYRPDGVLEFAGRVDDQVKIRGYRVELGEVEAALHDQAEVGDVAVRVRSSAGGERELVGYLSPAAGTTIDTGALAERLAAVLPAHLVPSAFVVLDALPLTGNGKVDHAALPDPETVTRPYVGPRTALENVLARTWARALGLPRVGVTDSFVELGGHSMTVMKVIVALREEHGIRLSFRDFYAHRTIAELARAGAAGSSEMDTVVWLRRTGNRPPLFCVHPGSAHWFAALAEHLDADQPVGAFEWPGLSRPCAAPESVEAIAELNLAELRRISPTGPYRLLGWCGGSQITTEMVRRLRAEGEEVTFILLDPALDTYERDNMHEIMSWFRQAESLLAALAEAAPEDVPELQRAAVAVLEKIVDDGTVNPPEPGDEFWPSRVRVWRELLATRMDYRHRHCDGELHLLTGDEVAAGVHEVAEGVSYRDYTARWAELVGELRVHRVPGNHLGVLRAPHVAEVARRLSTLLNAGSED